MKETIKISIALALIALLALSNATAAGLVGVQAELRSSAAILPPLAAGTAAATAPAGSVTVGAQTWICDASEGFTQALSVEPANPDPFLAVSTAGIHLPISATTVPATCGQMAYDGNGNIYITQAVADTRNTPSSARGILRETIDPQTGALIGPGTYIAITAGLDGNQPTAAAIGPDGNLYVGFLKNGNIKRIINPSVGTTQVVQTVGNTPSGHAARALAFSGNDLYIGSVDAFSEIHSATATTCTGGCNAIPINDGFSGLSHTGVTSDGADNVYFAVSGNNQIWRYTPSNQTFAFVAQGGADRNGANASNFSFVAGKTNLLNLDAGGNLWIGDDPSNGAVIGAGRIWTISALALAGIPGGTPFVNTNTQAIANVLRGPWEALVGNTIFVPTFNADGTFTATIQNPGAAITTISGTWTLTPPIVPSFLANPQGTLTLVDSNGGIVLSGTVLLLNADQLVMLTAVTNIIPVVSIGEVIITKMTV